MCYECESFDNFYCLNREYPDVAIELLEEVGFGDWMGEQLIYYPSVEDFAEYELTDGWYIDNNFSKSDYKGAPNPLDYIDLYGLGEALLNRGDESVGKKIHNCVITTSHGW